MERIKLHYSERMIAGVAAMLRSVQDDIIGTKPAYGVTETAPEYDLTGAIGELAYAKYFGVYWSGTVGKLSLPDVGPFQVRATTVVRGGLLVHPAPTAPGERGDDPNHRFYLAITRARGVVELHGWAWGYEVQKPELWCDARDPKARFRLERPAFVLERQFLHDLSE